MKSAKTRMAIIAIAFVVTVCGLVWASIQSGIQPDVESHREIKQERDPAQPALQSRSEYSSTDAETGNIESLNESGGLLLTDSFDQTNTSKQFYSAENYFDFAAQMYSIAQSGDSGAQYYLYRALAECEDWIRTREQSTAGKSLNEKFEPSASGDAFRDFRIDQYYRCVQFLDVEPDTFQSAAYWLDQAVANAHSGALSRKAIDVLFFSGDRDNAALGKEMLRKALIQPSAEAIWDLAVVYDSDVLLESRDEKLAAATKLLACRSGMNCSTTKNLGIHIECVLGRWPCESGSFVDSLREYYGSEFEELEELAEEVNLKIQNRSWTELHLVADEGQN